MQSCPNCKVSTIVIGGNVVSIGTSDTLFVPNHARHARRKPGVGLRHGFLACSSCGHVWTSLVPEELRSFFLTDGTELARQHLQTLEGGPHHDLPDTPEAEAAGDRVAEIDALVLRGRQPEATRRYREMMTTTWDEAIDALRRWQDLVRPQKLAHMGWRTKDKPVADVTDELYFTRCA